jgi:hypothetical protein
MEQANVRVYALIFISSGTEAYLFLLGKYFLEDHWRQNSVLR